MSLVGESLARDAAAQLRRAGDRFSIRSASRGRVALTGLVLLCALTLAMSPPPADRKVYAPLYEWCYTKFVLTPSGEISAWTKATEPVLYAYNKRARLGPVTPGTCAWIDGYTARTVVTLACEYQGQVAHSTRALEAPNPSPAAAAACAVPAAQDFR